MDAKNKETVTIKAPLPHRQRAAPKGTENRDILMSTPFLVSADTNTSGMAIALKIANKIQCQFSMNDTASVILDLKTHELKQSDTISCRQNQTRNYSYAAGNSIFPV